MDSYLFAFRGTLIFLALIILGPICLKIWLKNRVLNPLTPVPRPKTFKEALAPYAIWLLGAGVIVVLGVGVYLMPSLSSINDIDWSKWIASVIVIGGAIWGMRYAGQGSKWLTVFVAVGAVLYLGSYVAFGEKAPEVLKAQQERNYKEFQNSGGGSSGGSKRSKSEEEKADRTEWVVTNLPVQLDTVDGQGGAYVPGRWSAPWEKPRGADPRCEYYSDVGVGRWYAIKTGGNEKPLNLNSEKYVRLDGNVKTYYFMILIEGKGGFEVIQRCPA